MPLPEPLDSADPRHLPGGTGLTTDGAHVTRGVGYGVTLKNLAFSEGFDDYADVRVVLTPVGVEVHTAAIEVGQGLITVLQQIVRSVLEIEQVAVIWTDTSGIGSSGSTSASRQTQMTGGGAYHAATALRDKVLEQFDADDLSAAGVWRDGELVATLDEVCSSGPIEHEIRFRHPETSPPDENGQGNMHAGFAVAAQRAVLQRVAPVVLEQSHGVRQLIRTLRGSVDDGRVTHVGFPQVISAARRMSPTVVARAVMSRSRGTA